MRDYVHGWHMDAWLHLGCWCSWPQHGAGDKNQEIKAPGQQQSWNIIVTYHGHNGGKRSHRFHLHLPSAEPCPAEPKGLLPQKRQLQWGRRRATKHQPQAGLLCLTTSSSLSLGKGQTELATVQISQDCLVRCPLHAGQTCCGANGNRGSQMEPDQGLSSRVSPCH